MAPRQCPRTHKDESYTCTAIRQHHPHGCWGAGMGPPAGEGDPCCRYKLDWAKSPAHDSDTIDTSSMLFHDFPGLPTQDGDSGGCKGARVQGRKGWPTLVRRQLAMLLLLPRTLESSASEDPRPSPTPENE